MISTVFKSMIDSAIPKMSITFIGIDNKMLALKQTTNRSNIKPPVNWDKICRFSIDQ